MGKVVEGQVNIECEVKRERDGDEDEHRGESFPKKNRKVHGWVGNNQHNHTHTHTWVKKDKYMKIIKC